MNHVDPGKNGLDATKVFDQHRDRLMSVAYRVLGRVADAEDVVQDAWLRWVKANPEEVVDPRAFLVRVTTRLAIDRLRRVQARRETYVGPWLPEPLVTRGDVADDVILAESVSMAMLVVLETLSPLERAVFVLREAFSLPYAEIAEIIDRGEPAVRQLARRAREHVRARRPRFQADQESRRRVTERFLAAGNNGDLAGLMEVLAPGVTLVADGGGKVPAPRRPVVGADRIARFFLGIWTTPLPDPGIHLTHVNGGPGLVVTSQGAPIAVVILDVADGAAQTVHLIANPDKLSGVSAIAPS